MKEHHVPGVSEATAFVVNEAVIHGAPRRDEPSHRQHRVDDDVGALKLCSRLSDVELQLVAKQRLQFVSNAEWQPPDGSDDAETFLFQVGPKCSRQFSGSRDLSAGHRRPEAHANRAEKEVKHATGRLHDYTEDVAEETQSSAIENRRDRCLCEVEASLTSQQGFDSTWWAVRRSRMAAGN